MPCRPAAHLYLVPGAVAASMHALGQTSATSAAHSLAWLLQARELIRQEEALPEPEGEIEFIEVPDTRERWDCESVLSASSNLYNHPGRIAEPCQRSAAGIRLSRKTGGPVGSVWAPAVRCGLSHLPRACRSGMACPCRPVLARVDGLQLSRCFSHAQMLWLQGCQWLCLPLLCKTARPAQ